MHPARAILYAIRFRGRVSAQDSHPQSKLVFAELFSPPRIRPQKSRIARRITVDYLTSWR